MIGSSLPLCYPQIGAPNLFFRRALDQICPLTKHIRLVGVCAFSGVLHGLELAPLQWHYLVPPTSGQRQPLRLSNKSLFKNNF